MVSCRPRRPRRRWHARAALALGPAQQRGWACSGNGTSIVSKSRGTSVGGENGARLVAYLATAVARGHVRERQQSHLGVARRSAAARPCCGRSRARARPPPRRTWPRARARRRGGRRARASRRARCRLERTTCGPRCSGPMTCSGAYVADRLAALQPPEVGTGLDAEPLRQLGVEATGTGILEQCVADARAGVRWLDRKGGENVRHRAFRPPRARARSARARNAAGRRPGASRPSARAGP